MRGVVHYSVFVDPGLQPPMHVVMHDVWIHVVQGLGKGEEAVAHSAELHSDVGFVEHQLVRDGFLAGIVACILVNVHIVQLLVGRRYVSKR